MGPAEYAISWQKSRNSGSEPGIGGRNARYGFEAESAASLGSGGVKGFANAHHHHHAVAPAPAGVTLQLCQPLVSPIDMVQELA